MQTNITNVTYGIIKSSINLKLISSLSSANTKIIEFPSLKTEKCLADEKNKKFVDTLSDFDWLIFKDVLAVEYFLEILEEEKFDLFELDNFRVCSLGEAVADRLRFVQVHSDVIPTNLKTENILDEISQYISDDKEFIESRFLIVKGGSGKSEVYNLIEKKGVFAREISIYKFIAENSLELTKSKTLLIGGAIDKFIFSSPNDLLVLKEVFLEENFIKLFKDLNFVATDEITFQYLRENGFKAKMFFQPG